MDVTYTFEFPYRDPWKWAKGLVKDKTLFDLIMWNSVDKFLHDGDQVYRLLDETNTAERWREVDVCFLLLQC